MNKAPREYAPPKKSKAGPSRADKIEQINKSYDRGIITESEHTHLIANVNKADLARKNAFKPDDKVRVKEGPMAGSEGVVESFDLTTWILKVRVSIFGRETPINVEDRNAEKI